MYAAQKLCFKKILLSCKMKVKKSKRFIKIMKTLTKFSVIFSNAFTIEGFNLFFRYNLKNNAFRALFFNFKR